MLPSRGLRPVHLISLAPRRALHIRTNGSRKFSSVPRTSLLASSRRTSPLQPSNWRTGAVSPPSGLLSASSIRYGSWYAPWSWGGSSAPSGDVLSPSISPEPVTNSPSAPDPVVTSTTPELAPAGIDKPAVVDNTVPPELAGTIEELLADPQLPPTADFSTTSIDHFGQLKEMGLDYGWGPSAFFEWLIEHVHLLSGYGWGPSIIFSTIVIRGSLFYFQAQGSDQMGKLAGMKPVLENLQKQTEEAIKNGDKEKENLYKLKQQTVGRDIGAKLGRGFLGPGLIGVFGFGAFRCLRGMGTLPAPGMSEAGFLWFTDLTISDPYYALPALTGAIMWVVMKTGGESGVQNQATQSQQKIVQNILPIFMTGMTMFQPAAIQLYFFCSSALGSLTGRMLRSPSVRSFMNISPLPTEESHNVYRQIIKENKPIQSIRGKDGKFIYQAPIAPSTTTSSTTTKSPNTLHGLNLKPGTKIPTHLKPILSDKEKERLEMEDDYKRGMPKEGRTSWVATHYQPKAVIGRLREQMKTPDPQPVIAEEKPKSRVVSPRVGSQTSEVVRRKKLQKRK